MWPKSRTELLLLAVLTVSCRQDMHDQLKVEPLEESDLYEDGRSSRHPVKGTVARGKLKADRHLHFGRGPITEPLKDGIDDGSSGELVDTFPYPVDEAMMKRGQQRYDIFCSPCHSKTGDGNGMVVQRGYRQPPTLHSDKLREASTGHIYDVIRRGLGVMPAYATMIPTEDRWAIVAYVRALQLSQHAELSDVPKDEAARLGPPPAIREVAP